MAGHFLPRPGGVCGRQSGPEGRGQRWQGAPGRSRARGVTRARPMRAGGLRAPWRRPTRLRPAGPAARKAVGSGRPVAAQPSVSRPAPGRSRPAFQRWGHRGARVFFYLLRVCVHVGASSCRGTCEVRGQRARVGVRFPSITWVLAAELRSTRCPAPRQSLRANLLLPSKVLKSSPRCGGTITPFESPPQKPQRQNRKGV